MVGDAGGLQTMRRKIGLFRDMHFELAVERQIDGLGAGEQRTRELLEVANRVDRIIVSADDVDTDLIAELSTICRKRQVKLSVVSPLRGRALPSLQISQLADLPILEYNTWDASRSSILIKRTFDIVTSASRPDRCSRRCSRSSRSRSSSIRAAPSSSPRSAPASAAARSGCTSSGRCASTPRRCSSEVVSLEELDDPMFKIRDDPAHHPRRQGPAPRSRSTRSRSSSTSCSAR